MNNKCSLCGALSFYVKEKKVKISKKMKFTMPLCEKCDKFVKKRLKIKKINKIIGGIISMVALIPLLIYFVPRILHMFGV